MKFSKKELKEKLGFTKEEADIVIQFQKELPILLNDYEGCCVNSRDLYCALKVKKKFSDWIKQRLEDIETKENEDYQCVWMKEAIPWEGNADLSSQKMSSLGYSLEYFITIDIAKEISMLSGLGNKANEEMKSMGKLTRKYYITIEKAFRRLKEWNMIREPEKEMYKELCSELDKYIQRNYNKKPMWYDYANEADALNLICLGAKAKDIRAYLNVQDKKTRDHLFVEYNTYLLEMQKLDMMYLKMNMEKTRRYDLIQQGFKALYPHASFVIANEFIKNQNNEYKIS